MLGVPYLTAAYAYYRTVLHIVILYKWTVKVCQDWKIIRLICRNLTTMMMGLNIELRNINTNTNLPTCGEMATPPTDITKESITGKTDTLKHKLITARVHIAVR